MNTYELIADAIRRKQQVVATYRGHVREMCPHVLGRREGQARCLFFQFGGGSSKGLPPGGEWRCIPLDGLAGVTIRDGPWHTTPHSEPQTCVDDVDLVAEP